MTKCTTEQLIFSFFRKRQLTVTFDGGEITSDAGLLLIRQADNSLHLTETISGCTEDRRESRYSEHSMVELLKQRIYQVVAGYEDCNDANVLRKDPALKAACDLLLSDPDLASQPTLLRLENSVTSKDLYERYEKTGQKQRLFTEGKCQAQSWDKERRVIIKAEWLDKGANSRFVVTNFSIRAKKLYEFYTERGGTCEVRIDEFKNGLKADRLSCHRFLANQFRLFLHAAAHWLVLRLRESLAKTKFSSLQIQQLRLRLLKIGGQVIQTARRVWFRLASGYPWKNIFALAHRQLHTDSC